MNEKKDFMGDYLFYNDSIDTNCSFEKAVLGEDGSIRISKLEDDNDGYNIFTGDKIHSKILSIKYSPYGDRLLLVCLSELYYIQLPVKMNMRNESKENEIKINRLIIPEDVVCKIVKALWYPYSNNNIIVLRDDNSLCYFNINESNEYIFNLNLLSDDKNVNEKIVSFCIGSNHLWDKYTVYLMNKNGEIYYLSGIIPPGLELSKNELRELEKEYEDDYLRIIYLKEWQERSLLLRKSEYSKSLYKDFYEKVSIMKMVSDENSWILKDDNGSDIIVLSDSSIPIIVRLFESGYCDFISTLLYPKPKFLSNKNEDKIDEIICYIIEMIELCNKSENKKVSKYNRYRSEIKYDILNPNRLFILNNCMIYHIDIKWFDDLLEMLNDSISPSRTRITINEFESSKIYELSDRNERKLISGLSIVNNPINGSMIIYHENGNKIMKLHYYSVCGTYIDPIEEINLEIEFNENLSLNESNSLSKMLKSIEPIKLIESSKCKSSEKCVKLLNDLLIETEKNQFSKLWSFYVNYENKLIYVNNSYNELMKQRNGLIKMMNDTIDNHNAMQNDIDDIVEYQNHLQNRLNKICKMINEIPSESSKMNFKEIEEMKVQIDNVYKSKLMHLENESKRLKDMRYPNLSKESANNSEYLKEIINKSEEKIEKLLKLSQSLQLTIHNMIET